MKQNNLKSCIRKFTPQKKRAVAEVISSLLLVAITVVGAVILTTFLDESFISAGLSASSSDSTIKTITIIKYDSRDGGNLLGYQNLNNTSPVDQKLCRASCSSNPNANPIIPFNGTEFLVIQVENQSVNPIFLYNVWLGNATHSWDPFAAGADLQMIDASSVTNGGFPGDGKFSILSTDTTNLKQRDDNQINNGERVNIIIKLDASNPDIQLSKTIRTQFNIGANQLSESLIESGGAQ
jgi:flagellin-like protein